MKSKLLLGMALIALSSFAVAQEAQNKNSNKTDDLQYSHLNAKNFRSLPVPTLGGSYSDDIQMAKTNSCMEKGDINYKGGTKGIIQLGDAKTFDQIEKTLNIDISGEASIGKYSGEASASYASYTKSTAYSESFYYSEQIILPTQVFTPAGLSTTALNEKFGLPAYKAGPDVFRLVCGNSYIAEQPMGANLIATFKINFNSLYEKTNFDLHTAGSIGNIFNAASNIKRVVTENHIRGNLELSAYQEGGDATHLANIFQKCEDHYCVTVCALDKLEDCQHTIDGIISYAQKDFPNQIDYKDGKILGSAMPLSYFKVDYAEIYLDAGKSVITPEIFAARTYLGTLYNYTRSKVDFVDHILQSPISPIFLKEDKERLEKTSNDLHVNASLLSNSSYGAIGCYLRPNECITIKDNIVKTLKPIDLEILDRFNTAYNEQGGEYMIIPIGGDQFRSYGDGLSHFTSQETIKILNVGQSGEEMYLDGVDIKGNHLNGHFAKVGDSTYRGYLYYNGGAPRYRYFTRVSNPL